MITGKELRKRRDNLKLSVEQISSCVGVNVTTVYAWERNGLPKLFGNTLRYLRVLGVDIEEIIAKPDTAAVSELRREIEKGRKLLAALEGDVE